MPKLPCPSADLSALRAHLEQCSSCRTHRADLVELALEILSPVSEAVRSNQRGKTFIIHNRAASDFPAGVSTGDSPTFREFVNTRFEADVLRHLKKSGR